MHHSGLSGRRPPSPAAPATKSVLMSTGRDTRFGRKSSEHRELGMA